MVLGFIGVIVALAVLITLAFRGHSVIYVAPLAALIGALFSGSPLLATYTQIFMPAAGSFIINFFPLFLAGAIFGQLMSVSGYADNLATWISATFGPKRAVLATAVATAVLTYGGISAWVIAFTIYPIGVALFRQANLPRRLMPAAIALGIFTFATAALPGSPQIHNAIPTKFLGTTTFAAPVLGIIGSIITFGLGMAWLEYRAKKLAEAGEVFIEPKEMVKPGASTATAVGKGGTAARGMLGLLPVLVVIVMNLLFVFVFSKTMDFGYLAEKKYGETTIGAVTGVWSVTVALATAILVIFLLSPRRFGAYIDSLSIGAKNSAVPIFSTASEVGFGAVIASLAVFAALQNSMFNMSDNPILLGAVATAVISGITGSSSGGLSITLTTFGEQLTHLATEQGISLEFLHRVMAMASVSFDSLPHNGAIVTLLVVCGLTHRESYKDIAVVTILGPLVGVVAIMILGSVLPIL
ncbi:GntP family permease [Brevibacterium ravenspurgense]|uniref:GntP family permease n=1 Tax=Brevibacterium ravenspurgense TaxID=479117 RepID=UPI001EF24E03|nr:GntP family permease [Brevibacterium ravenspurgense]MCG7300558.1 GntP family permease [Brevibacterium ravenspurgense]